MENNLNLKYIEDQTEAMCIDAVQKDIRNFKFVKNKTELIWESFFIKYIEYSKNEKIQKRKLYKGLFEGF